MYQVVSLLQVLHCSFVKVFQDSQGLLTEPECVVLISNLSATGLCSRVELSTKVKMSRRLRRSPSGDQCASAEVLFEHGLLIYLLFIYFSIWDWARSRSLFSLRNHGF